MTNVIAIVVVIIIDVIVIDYICGFFIWIRIWACDKQL